MGVAGALSSRTYEVADSAEATALYAARGWTDGFPIFAPTSERVEACLEWAALRADQVIGIEPVRARPIVAEKLAVNAVMAGCQPPHFPVVAAAFDAMCKPDFLLHGATASTGGCAVLVIVNGPIRRELNMDPTHNALANGDHATAVIGRAVRLGLMNLLDARPGDLDRSTLGHPGKFSFCLAEDEDSSPWPSLAEERDIPSDTSSVTVLAAGSPRQIMNEWTTEPEDILETFAAEMRANMLNYSIWGGNYALVIPKQLRDRLTEAGWSKADVRHRIHDRARVTRGDWDTVGKGNVVNDDNRDTVYTALPSPDDLLVIAAGGPAGGFGAVILPWFGYKSRAITAAIGACVDC